MSAFYRHLLRSLLLVALAAPALAQSVPYSFERPGGLTSDPLEHPRDVSGRSVKTPRVRVLHDGPPGSATWLVKNDPWLAYAWGRELALREFSSQEGAFGESGRLGGTTLDDQATPMMSRGHVNSCAACHNTPWRDMGAGITIAKNAGSGRNTPHLYGAGVVEMIGQTIREELLHQADANRDRWISKEEARGSAIVQDKDFGRFDDADEDGRPDLNEVVYVWYVDKNGKRISWARSLNDPEVAGYNFSVQVFGHGQNDRIGHGGLGDSLRSVAARALDMHSGLQAFDPTCNDDPDGDGLTGVSLPGAQQFHTAFTRDLGAALDERGLSLDDPDRDGVIHEITEGDLDLLEFYLLNHPTPAENSPSPKGRQIAETVGCFECHTPSWSVSYDRRFFDIKSGALTFLTKGPRTIDGIYSDFRQHDLGPAYHELQFDGTMRTKFRTPPLWGVGTSAPYGHDGASLTLEEAILRHGGEAAETTRRYKKLDPQDREELHAFLRSLVLYSTDTTPIDVDGDGRVSGRFFVAGVDTGPERFNPEWLFRIRGRIEGSLTNNEGRTILSKALVNLREAYGLDLPGLQDLDRDGIPDLMEGKT